MTRLSNYVGIFIFMTAGLLVFVGMRVSDFSFRKLFFFVDKKKKFLGVI
jgi:hypothetical protein